MFNTASHLGRNAAVIIAWIIMSCATLTLFTWLLRRIERRRLRAFQSRTRSKSPENTPSKVEKGKEKSEA